MYRYDVEHVISRIIIHRLSFCGTCVYLGSRTTSVFSFALITVRIYVDVRAPRVCVYHCQKSNPMVDEHTYHLPRAPSIILAR